jgi:hypothetical protein
MPIAQANQGEPRTNPSPVSPTGEKPKPSSPQAYFRNQICRQAEKKSTLYPLPLGEGQADMPITQAHQGEVPADMPIAQANQGEVPADMSIAQANQGEVLPYSTDSLPHPDFPSTSL